MKEMKEIKLNKLSLRDFQGGTVILDADGKDTFIFGANASGKTRLVSAFSWLLFGKDALGHTDFEIKNLDAKGEAMHGLEHSVEAELDVDGQTTALKKVFREKWNKKRGNIEREFSGHSTDYFVDGVPLQEKLYIQHIVDITGNESRFRLLTSPMTFPALHWQKQRQLLLEICGDISDNDVILSDEKLAPLIAILGKHTLEDHRKIVIARRSEINKEMEKIPIRIDEVHRGLPDISGLDLKTCKQEVASLETALNNGKLRLQGIDSGGVIADLSKKLQGLNADLRKMEEIHRSESLSTLNHLNQQISEIWIKVGTDRRRVQTINGELNGKEGQLQRLERDLVSLREQWTTIDAETFKGNIADTCTACGQPLPPERVQEAKDKALARFNHDKAERLGEIDRKGQNLKSQTENFKGQIEALRKEFEPLDFELPSMEHKLKSLTDERETLKEASEDFSILPHWSETFGEIEAYERLIQEEREGKTQDIQKIKIEISSLETDFFLAKSKANMFVNHEQGEARIEELKTEEKKFSKEFEKLEGELYLMDEFIKAKVSMLTDRINEKFEMIRFKLFNQLINGGIEEVCEITVSGVPFDSGLNNGARINAGLEIVRVLQEHYKLRVPVFADNAEAVNSLVDVGCQMIRLYVSEDKQLRVELREPKKKTQQPRFEFQASGKQL